MHEITYHTFVHENVKEFMQGFRYDAHPMGMLMASVGALSTFYPDARNIGDADNRHMQIVRMIAKMPTLGAWSFRHAQGKPFIYPDNDLSYTANFLSMLFKMSEQKFDADERLVKALDVLFILHADHEQNCSTNAVRSVGSSQVDPYSAVAAGVAALYGPLHGGANEAVLRMLKRIGSKENIPDFIKGVKDGNERLMGFGHRVYKNFDPRATIIKKACDDVFEVTGVNPLLEIAKELEKIALEDDYFIKRKLYPNVDFYSGLIYEAFQFPPEMFTVLFAIGRTPGWLAQWLELVQDKEQKIARPKQIYTGDRTLDFVSCERALGTGLSARAGVIWDLGNVLIDWEPRAGDRGRGRRGRGGPRFLAADDFDFMALEPRPRRGRHVGGRRGRGTPDAPALGRARRGLPRALRALAGRRGARHRRLVRELHAAGVPQWGLTNWSARALPARAAALRLPRPARRRGRLRHREGCQAGPGDLRDRGGPHRPPGRGPGLRRRQGGQRRGRDRVRPRRDPLHRRRRPPRGAARARPAGLSGLDRFSM